MLDLVMVVCKIHQPHWRWSAAIISTLLYFFVFQSRWLCGEAALQLVVAVLLLWVGWQWLPTGDAKEPTQVIGRQPRKGQVRLGRQHVKNGLLWLMLHVISVALFAHKGLWPVCILYVLLTRMCVRGCWAGQARLTAART